MNMKHLPHNHGNQIETFAADMPDDKAYQTAASIFSQLSDGSRLKILWLLCRCEECGINLAAALDMSTASVSHHLKSLKLHGLITSRRAGKEVYYTLNHDNPAAILMQKSINEYFEL